MKSVGRAIDARALHAIGAIQVSSGITESLYEPDNLDLSGLAAAEQNVAAMDAVLSIKAKIQDIDQKRIRPLAEGDAVYLAKLNKQIIALREQLK